MNTDQIELILKIVTVVFAGLAAWKALAEFRLNRIQRKNDLRWKQAEAAKKLIDEWMDDSESYKFCKMVEYENRNFKNEEGRDFTVNYNLIRAALNEDGSEIKTEEEVNKRSMRDWFDSFLYYTELMQQGVESGLYCLKNLKYPLRYYLKKMKDVELYRSVVNYANKYGFTDSIKLFNDLLEPVSND